MDEVEIDLRVTSDGVVVVHHDRILTDPDGNKHDIRQSTYADLKRHKADLTTMQEAIETIGRKAPLQFEVKWGEQTAPVIAIIEQYLSRGWQPSDFLVGSKKQRTLMEIHRALPAIPKVIIEPFSGVRASIRARQIGASRVSMRWWWLWSGFIRPFSRRYELYAYTLDDPKRAKRWHRLGLNGIITDRPDLFEK